MPIMPGADVKMKCLNVEDVTYHVGGTQIHKADQEADQLPTWLRTRRRHEELKYLFQTAILIRVDRRAIRATNEAG
jgi:hypothetical protein